MGNTCKPMADSFQCMTKPTTIKKKKKENEALLLLLKILQKTKEKNEESGTCRTSLNTLAYTYDISKIRREKKTDKICKEIKVKAFQIL